MARLSFRSKLLLVLFVPFLALVVVAAAGLSDRFTALHAQEQYGDLVGAAALARRRQPRAPERERRVVVVRRQRRRARVAELDGGSCAHRRRRDARSAPTSRPSPTAGLEPGRARPRSTAANRGLDEHSPRCAARSTPGPRPRPRAREFFLASTSNLLDFGERVARDLASADVVGEPDPRRSRSSGRSTSSHARRASYIAVLAERVAAATSASGSARMAADAQLPRALHQRRDRRASSRRSPAASWARRAGAGAAARPRSRPRRQTPARVLRRATSSRRGSSTRRSTRSTSVDQRRRRARTPSAALRDVRVYGGAAVFAMLLTLAADLVRVPGGRRPGAHAHRRRARDVAAPAARSSSSRSAPAATSSAVQPTRIEVTSEDEIGELAQAFNDVEAVTIEVAHEQSRLLRKGMGDLFVNLARRNQSLLERQLELLDELERNEHDPAALDALFKLDHMATRMRRNAESLLVLSGAEQPRQWQQPIALLDVVRAAAAEIADFPRVELVGVDDDARGVGPRGRRRRAPPRRAARERDVVLAARLRGRRLGRVDRDRASCSRSPTRASACRPSGSPRPTSCSPSRRSSASRSRGPSACTWSARSRPATASPSSCAPARRVGLVALVTLPPRCSSLERRRPPPPTAARPVYAPDVGRRRRSRRRSAPAASRGARPTSRRWRSGAARASPTPSRGARRRRARPSTVPAASRPPVEPPPRRRRRRAAAGAAASSAAGVERAARAPPTRRPAFDATAGRRPPSTSADDDAPLPTRVPGHHLSHQPTAGGRRGRRRGRPAAPVPRARAADPPRPGQAPRPGRARRRPATARRRRPVPTSTAVPDASGHVQEDGR